MIVYYLMIALSALIFALQFMLNDGYQRESGSGWNSSLKFSLYSSIVGFAALFAINKFECGFSLFSLTVAVVYSMVCIALNYFTIKALKIANLSVYSVFFNDRRNDFYLLYTGLCAEKNLKQYELYAVF